MQRELEGFEPFCRLGEAGRRLLAAGAVMRDAGAAAALLHKGQPVSGAYVVVRGRLRVFTITPRGHEATLYFIDPGETCVLALNCLFNDLLYPAWVQAEAPSRVAMIPGAIYRQLFDTEPVIRSLTVHALSTLVFRLMAELELVHASHHRQRLAQFLLVHASSEGEVRMTQQQLAHHLGTTREVVARVIKGLVDEQLVRTARGSIAIRDVFALRRLLAPDAPRALDAGARPVRPKRLQRRSP